VQYANIDGAASRAYSFRASTSAMWATRSASTRREAPRRSDNRRSSSSSEIAFRFGFTLMAQVWASLVPYQVRFLYH
jgi:hypothetical protein